MDYLISVASRTDLYNPPMSAPSPAIVPRPRQVSGSPEAAYAGPIITPRSPPASLSDASIGRRSLRTNGSADNASLSVPDNMVNTEVRVGDPVLCRLPAVILPKRHGTPLGKFWTVEVAQGVVDLLSSHAIPSEFIGAVWRRWIHDPPTQAKETLLVITPSVNDRDLWWRTAKELRSICIKGGMPDIAIEIANENVLKPTRTSCVPKGHTIIKAWPRIRAKVLGYLALDGWVSVEVLRRGLGGSSEDPVTILVTLSEDSAKEACQVRDSVCAILEHDKLDDVAVEIRHGWLVKSHDDDDVDPAGRPWYERLLPDGSWDPPAVLGGSIGPQDMADGPSGTFGGFIELRSPHNHKWKRFALTAGHCVFVKPPNMTAKDERGTAKIEMGNVSGIC